MSKKIYVGNLPWSASDDSLRDMFARHGSVISARVITDRDTGRSRGFGFVEMEGADADAAIRALDGASLEGRNLRVNQAQEREERPQRSRW
ncbi:MAG: RNA recognition motif domain-containing protein [Thermodesulfobacteriota bacterium]